MAARPRAERGSAAVEFALLLPILLVLLVALVQVGVLARDSLVLAQASRAGAREAAVEDSESAVHEAVRAAAGGLDPERLRIEIVWASERGSPTTVTVGYAAPVAAVLTGWLLPDTVQLTASATMRREFA